MHFHDDILDFTLYADYFRHNSGGGGANGGGGGDTAEGGSIALTVASGQPGAGSNERAQEKRLTRISIFIVWLFIFCHSWKLFPTIYEAIQSDNGLHHDDWPWVILFLEHVSHLMITLNSAINFLIYLFL